MQIDKDLNSSKAELYLEIKEFLTTEIQKYSEEVWEKYSDNITSIYTKEFCSAFCYIKVKDDCVHIGWFQGIKVNDKYGFLFGDSKQIRGHKIDVLSSTHKKAISSYVEQSYIILVEKYELKKMKK